MCKEYRHVHRNYFDLSEKSLYRRILPCSLLCGGKFSWRFSITVQRNRMKFSVNVATNSDCVSLSLGLCSLFAFGVGSLLLE